MRARNPCVRLRFKLLGWNVLFMTTLFSYEFNLTTVVIFFGTKSRACLKRIDLVLDNEISRQRLIGFESLRACYQSAAGAKFYEQF